MIRIELTQEEINAFNEVVMFLRNFSDNKIFKENANPFLSIADKINEVKNDKYGVEKEVIDHEKNYLIKDLTLVLHAQHLFFTGHDASELDENKNPLHKGCPACDMIRAGNGVKK